jgi:hypothetical protein
MRRAQFKAIDACPSHRNCRCEPAADELLANARDFFGVLSGSANP